MGIANLRCDIALLDNVVGDLVDNYFPVRGENRRGSRHARAIRVSKRV